MQISKTSFLGKTNTAITTVVRNTSCNRGWLQLFTHFVCGTFTVTCFVLILLLALQVFQKPELESRCHVTSCRVVCHEAPYYGKYEDDIILATMEAEVNCQNVFLSLYEPAFTNDSLPENWLARLRTNVIEIGIIGGNLQHIPPNAFSAGFARHIHLLFLENVTISSWVQNMLVGLANLEHLFIKDCNIVEVQGNALTAVSQTLSALTVKRSGHFDPARITGSAPTGLPKLTTVDYSSNFFGSILGNNSFTRLRFCKSLYLSSSRITHIDPGAFNRMRKIEYLNLDNNFIQTIEPGLFNLITSKHGVRINLLDNPWHCDCADKELRRLIRDNTLLIDPVCHFPTDMRGKTFQEYHNLCSEKEPSKEVVLDIKRPKRIDIDEKEAIHSFECIYNDSDLLSGARILVSPFEEYQCATPSINVTKLRLPSESANIDDILSSFWMKPTLVISGKGYTMIELGSAELEGYGLVWYRNSCPNEIFCINMVPEIIRFYNMNMANHYTFCPIALNSGKMENDQCIAISKKYSKKIRFVSPLFSYIMIGLTCLLIGAVILYFLIRQYPHLLRGSKRLLFVKHKTVDALVLPPKVPLRSSLLSADSVVEFNDKHVADEDRSDFLIGTLVRSGSVRSSNSYAPSYISALQPSDEQLANWRQKLVNNDDPYATISIISSEMPPISITNGSDNIYFSVDGSMSNSSIGSSCNQTFFVQLRNNEICF